MKHLTLTFVALISVALAPSASAQAPAPVVGAKYYVEEKMLVKEGKHEWFENYWKTMVLPVFAEMDGYMGYHISTIYPEPGLEPKEWDFGELLPLGPPGEVFIPHGGLQLKGTVTNTMIHFDSLLRGTYNFKVIHYWRDAKSLRGLVPQFGPIWTRVNGDDDPWKVLETDYFVNLENHWDTVYRVLP